MTQSPYRRSIVFHSPLPRQYDPERKGERRLIWMQVATYRWYCWGGGGRQECNSRGERAARPKIPSWLMYASGHLPSMYSPVYGMIPPHPSTVNLLLYHVFGSGHGRVHGFSALPAMQHPPPLPTHPLCSLESRGRIRSKGNNQIFRTVFIFIINFYLT